MVSRRERCLPEVPTSLAGMQTQRSMEEDDWGSRVSPTGCDNAAVLSTQESLKCSWASTATGEDPQVDNQSCSGEESWLLDGEEYFVIEYIGAGGFGQVCMLQHASSGDICAAKCEDAQSQTLRWEADVLERLCHVQGFPAPRGFHVVDGYAVLLMECLELDLEKLVDLCGGRFSLKTVLYIAMQVLQRLEDLHIQGLVHRDVKPSNFAIGRSNSGPMIFALDLGLADEFHNTESNQHIAFRRDVGFTGTPDFASLHAHRGCSQSRRDDLEALGYMLVALLQGQLPWQGADHRGHQEYDSYVDHCAKQKSLLPLQMICFQCPKEFQLYLAYCRSLKFKDVPDYGYLQRLFQTVFEREGFNMDGVFDWTDQRR